MATIIEFPGSDLYKIRDTAIVCAVGDGTSSAEIIIFPGVRIERWDADNRCDQMPNATGDVRRDQMELLEN